MSGSLGPKQIPAGLQYWTADEIAECLVVSDSTYARLWEITSAAKNPKPLGGDGTDGTWEWPEVTDEHDNQPLAFWGRLTPSQQQEIINAYAVERLLVSLY